MKERIENEIENEIDWLQRVDVIEPVKFSRWAAPVVLVVKKDGSVWLCRDYKLMINGVSPLVSIRYRQLKLKVFAQLAGGKMFSKLDFTCIPPIPTY